MSMEKRRVRPMETERHATRERLLEDAFVTGVQERVIEAMSDALEEAGFTEHDERAFRKTLAALPLDEVNGVLSLPHELRHVRLKKLHERMEKGASIAQVVEELAREARERKFTLGYHMSNSDIVPQKTAKGSETWTVNGREQDHRDSDLPMAYYSTDLANLYGKKRARFLYIVRAEMGQGTTHRQDNDGSWGRATKLDIVDKIDYETLMQQVRERAKQTESISEAA